MWTKCKYKDVKLGEFFRKILPHDNNINNFNIAKRLKTNQFMVSGGIVDHITISSDYDHEILIFTRDTGIDKDSTVYKWEVE